MLLLIKSIYNYIKSIFGSKNISINNNHSNGVSFYIDSKNHIMMNVDINDPDTLSLDELTDNAEKTAIIITSIINGDINDQILTFIKKSSKTIETSANTNLFFQNVLSYHEMQQKEKVDNIKTNLYDKVVIRPSEAFNRYV
tara:strand:- start:12624 stop:13046 length:423 start_codon:yes stop_codon:yes gene_type:complete